MLTSHKTKPVIEPKAKPLSLFVTLSIYAAYFGCGIKFVEEGKQIGCQEIFRRVS